MSQSSVLGGRAVEDEQGRIRHGSAYWMLKFASACGLGRTPTVDLHDGEGRGRRVGEVFAHERRQIRRA